MTDVTLNYPVWLRIEHWVNLLFITLLIRSGIEILASYPRLHRRNDSKPGTEWARFTTKTMPADKLYDTLDEEEAYSSIVALPGHKKLGMGRRWHFVSLLGWVLTGVAYYVLLFATGQWHRYIPYSWSIFPEAVDDAWTYLQFQLPPTLPDQPLDALQKLVYAAVIFLLAPFQILTGAAQSPAVEARFPWYVKLFGGRQMARTLHGLGLLAFLGFIPVHLIMIGWWGWPELTSLMIFGHVTQLDAAIGVSLGIIAAIVVIHVAATEWSLRNPRQVQRALGAIIMRFRHFALKPLTSRQDYPRSKLSSEHRVNGKPPSCAAYQIMAVHNFADWRLEVGGLVERPMSFSLADLRALREPQTQRVLHNCIQGWSSIGEWSGVPLRSIIDLVRPLPGAHQICFLTMQNVDRDEPAAAEEGHGQTYEIIDLERAYDPQALLAYEMNGEPLPIKHGAPLRVRFETQVGFKMAKWIERIEVISEYDGIGDGMGGWREDNVHYDISVGI
jgi:thiosulfate reductase cytochrome b subunit